MATHTGHTVAAHFLALALSQFLDLAHAPAGDLVGSINKVREVVGDALARPVVQNLAAHVFNARIALQMATDANRIPPLRVKFYGIDDGGFACTRNVAGCVSVAALASNAPMKKRKAGEVVECPRIFALHVAHVASHATTGHAKGRRQGRKL